MKKNLLHSIANHGRGATETMLVTNINRIYMIFILNHKKN